MLSNKRLKDFKILRHCSVINAL